MARLVRDPDTCRDVPPAWRPLLKRLCLREPSQRPTADEVRAHLLARRGSGEEAASVAPDLGSAHASGHAVTQPLDAATRTAELTALVFSASDGASGSRRVIPLRALGVGVAVGLVAALGLTAAAMPHGPSGPRTTATTLAGTSDAGVTTTTTTAARLTAGRDPHGAHHGDDRREHHPSPHHDDAAHPPHATDHGSGRHRSVQHRHHDARPVTVDPLSGAAGSVAAVLAVPLAGTGSLVAPGGADRRDGGGWRRRRRGVVMSTSCPPTASAAARTACAAWAVSSSLDRRSATSRRRSASLAVTWSGWRAVARDRISATRGSSCGAGVRAHPGAAATAADDDEGQAGAEEPPRTPGHGCTACSS